MYMTRHAEERRRSRAIPWRAIELILDFGTWTRVRGADSFHLDAWGLCEVRDLLSPGEYEALAPHFSSYVVVSDDGAIVTVARKTRRLRMH